jgi:hypothetical protein
VNKPNKITSKVKIAVIKEVVKEIAKPPKKHWCIDGRIEYDESDKLLNYQAAARADALKKFTSAM